MSTGFTSPHDWLTVRVPLTTKVLAINGSLPRSCCVAAAVDCAIDSTDVHELGCRGRSIAVFGWARRWAIGLALGKMFLLVVILLLSAVIFRDKQLVRRALTAHHVQSAALDARRADVEEACDVLVTLRPTLDRPPTRSCVVIVAPRALDEHTERTQSLLI